MIVADTSAWIELFRDTGSVVHRTLHRLLSERAELAITEVILMEALAGAVSERDLRVVRGTLLAFPILPLRGAGGYEAAAELYRACRTAGETVKTMTDCLIAVPAIRAGAAVLHIDDDFEKLARHTPLQVVDVSA